MAWTTPGTATAGEVLTAAFWNANVRDNLNALPRGIVAKVSQTSDFTLAVAQADVTGATVTWTAESNRIYLIQAYGYSTKTTNVGTIAVSITDSSNNPKQDSTTTVAAVTGFLFFTASVYETGLSGSITRKLRAACSTTGGTLNAGAAYPRQLIVIDMGLA